jgi:hypothetical protein
MIDGRDMVKNNQSMMGSSLVLDESKTNLEQVLISCLMIIFGPEALLKDEVFKYFNDFFVKIFGKEFLILHLLSSDWKALKELLEFFGICPFCSCLQKCSSHNGKDIECVCDKIKDNIGSKHHQSYSKDKLPIERWRIILESLHCSLRTSEHAISIVTYVKFK